MPWIFYFARLATVHELILRHGGSGGMYQGKEGHQRRERKEKKQGRIHASVAPRRPKSESVTESFTDGPTDGRSDTRSYIKIRFVVTKILIKIRFQKLVS